MKQGKAMWLPDSPQDSEERSQAPLMVYEDDHDFELFVISRPDIGVSIACLDETGCSCGLPNFTAEEARRLAEMLEDAAHELDSA